MDRGYIGRRMIESSNKTNEFCNPKLQEIKGLIKEMEELHDFEMKNKNYDRANTCAICMNIVKKWLVVEEEE